MPARSIRRRKFLEIGASAAAASTLSCGRESSSWRFFTAAEGRTVTALCDRIIPADQDPGAVWAGVPVFIDKQLVRFLKPHQKTYRAGLAAVERLSRSSYRKAFIELEAEQQSELMASMEREPAVKPFFDLLVAHTMQGFYGNPRHGGNRDAVSWRMLGTPWPPVRGRQV